MISNFYSINIFEWISISYNSVNGIFLFCFFVWDLLDIQNQEFAQLWFFHPSLFSNTDKLYLKFRRAFIMEEACACNQELFIFIQVSYLWKKDHQYTIHSKYILEAICLLRRFTFSFKDIRSNIMKWTAKSVSYFAEITKLVCKTKIWNFYNFLFG